MGDYDYSFQKTNQLILEILDLLKLYRVNLVFPCAGGFYGLAFTQAYPEKVNQLFVIQTPSLSEMKKWTKRIVPNYLKKPYLSQLVMPFVEKKFAKGWYDYALPKGKDRSPYHTVAMEGIKNGGTFCLCSLTQGLFPEMNTDLRIDPTIPMTLIYGTKDFTHKGTNFDSILQYHFKAHLVPFKGCGHFPDLEEPDQFIQLLKEKIS